MDPNQTPPQNPTPPITPMQPPVRDPNAPVMPQVDPLGPQPQPTATHSGGKKKTVMILIIVFLVVAILIVAGILMYSQVSKNNPDLTGPSDQSGDLKQLQNDANAIDLGNVEADFKDVDEGLSAL